MSLSTRFIIAEATCALALSRLAVRFFFPRIAPWATRPQTPGQPNAPTDLQRSIQRAVLIASKNVPWNSVCLPNAVAAKLMLARRGYGSTVHLGVGFREGNFSAHAWLESGDNILIGRRGMEGLSPLL